MFLTLIAFAQPQLDLACNCVATLNLVEACRKFADAKLVYTSTRQVYGRPKVCR